MSEPVQMVERHDCGPAESWLSSLDNAREVRRAILEREPRPSDGTELLACDRDIAALLAVTGGSIEAIAQAIASAAGAGAAGAMAQTDPAGIILLLEPGAELRRIPPGGARMTPLLWRDAALLACTARDQVSLGVLLRPACITACQVGERGDAFWPTYCDALARVLAGEDAVAAIDAAIDAISAATIARSDVLAALDRPLLTLARLLAQSNCAEWDPAVAQALQLHHDHHATEAWRYECSGFLAFGILGLCAAAHDRGIPTTVQSPYLPRGLIDGSGRGRLSTSVCAIDPGVSEDLADIAAALASAEGIKAVVRPVLEAIRTADLTAIALALAPRPEDYDRVFVPSAAEGARDVYERFWAAPPPFPSIDERVEAVIHASPAGMLASDNLLSRSFPGGYRAIAPLLDPHRVWIAWDYVQSGRTSGIGFDGLVWCEDHWAWFPRPFRLLGHLLPTST